MQETRIKINMKLEPNNLFEKGNFLHSENDETVYLVINKNKAVVIASPDDGIHCLGDTVTRLDIDDDYELFYGDIKVVEVKDNFKDVELKNK